MDIKEDDKSNPIKFVEYEYSLKERKVNNFFAYRCKTENVVY